MGLFSFIGGLLGASSQKKASRQAEADQIAYLNKALGNQQAQFAQTRQDNMPWITEGGKAIGAQGDLTGLNGNDAQQTAITGVQSSPYYESLYRNGLEANLQNAAATGGIRGGNEQRGLADFGKDTLAQSIQQQLANLGGISGQGAQTAIALGQIGQNNSNAQSGLYDSQGQVRASGLMYRGGLTAGMWNQAGQFADQVASAAAGGFAGGGGMAGMGNAVAGSLFNSQNNGAPLSIFGRPGGGGMGGSYGGGMISPQSYQMPQMNYGGLGQNFTGIR